MRSPSCCATRTSAEVVLVGTSAGGMVLARVAELARERIQRLVFVDALALLAGETIRDIVTRSCLRVRTAELATGPSRAPGCWRRCEQDMEPELAEWAADRWGWHPGRGVRPTGRARLVLGPGVGRDR